MDILEASNVLMLLQTLTDHHTIRGVNLEIAYMPEASEESAEMAEQLSAQGIVAQALFLEDPDGNEYPAIQISGW